MHFIPFLKAGSKRNNSVLPIALCCLFYMIIVMPLSGDEPVRCLYSRSDEGTIVLTFYPDSIPEEKIKKSVEQGHKSELYLTCRIQQTSGALHFFGGNYQEVNIRRTGFRDQITGDYVLLLNDREVAVFREWSQFFREFSSPLIYPSRVVMNRDLNIQVRVLFRVISKKLVPPFSILYLLPGKFMHKHPWQIALEGEGL